MKDDNDKPTHVPAETGAEELRKVNRLHVVCAELKTEMEKEVETMDVKLIRVAKDAREALAPMHKAIKKREDRKVSLL